MRYSKIVWEDLAATALLSSFETGQGVAEYHAMIYLDNPHDKAANQYKNIATAVSRLQQSEILQHGVPVFKRYFVSDAVNQQEFLAVQEETAAVSIVQQPPLNRTKVALWIYFVENGKVSRDASGTVVLERPACKHLYNTQLHNPIEDEYAETEYIFDTYTASLRRHQCTLKKHCIRTWIFVQGVDIHYAKMVKARVAAFNKEGLTKETHYIASTGIEGRHPNPQTLVQMDAYAVKGIQPEQIKYLSAPTHLNPTYEYGVTFERGTAVDYGDRRHVFISGTASINNKGEIVHPGNIKQQINRTMENVTTLLSEAGTTTADIAQMIVYLRDTADYCLTKSYFEEHHAEIPYIIVLAPVCRPGWLVEVECVAVKAIEENRFAVF
jgi:enamine deaminase RidA (YjgF/YER057c/UK114 family)